MTATTIEVMTEVGREPGSAMTADPSPTSLSTSTRSQQLCRELRDISTALLQIEGELLSSLSSSRAENCAPSF